MDGIQELWMRQILRWRRERCILWGKRKACACGRKFPGDHCIGGGRTTSAWEWIKYITTAEAQVDWTKATGYVPPRKDAENLEEFQSYLKEAPQLNACLEQMEQIVPFVSFPGDSGLEIEQDLLDTRDVIMNGEKTAQEALTQLQDKANDLLKQ